MVSAMVIASGTLSGQKKLIVKQAAYFDETGPLREMPMIVPVKRDRSWKDGIIRNETPEREPIKAYPLPQGADPLWQTEMGSRDTRMPFVNFEGIPNVNAVYPPDTDGDVGPDHYFQMINLSFQIFDKEGNSLYGPADNKTLWNGFIGPWSSTNDGDPILLYDELADRWVATQFAINTPDSTFWELIAVSVTGDPLGPWYRYAFEYPVFNDYPKLGVWPDGYYFSFNMFGADYRRVAVSAHEREKMLVGDPTAQMVLFDFPEGSLPWSFLPADFDGTPPPDGTPNYFIYGRDDAFMPGDDQLCLWEFRVDWDNPGNSTFEEVQTLPVEPFDSRLCDAPRGRCVHQPDGRPRLESLSDRLMFRLQYRNFGTYQAMVTNHTVDVDGNGHAGIRWYELRDINDGNGWFIYQQGTYAPDSDHRWMGSIAMDSRGYIALGYSVSSESTYPSIRYTGRSPNDSLGQMTFVEEEIIAGGGTQSGEASRWGDYSMMSVDPVDDTTFWYTTEYIEYNGTVSWQTRIAAFNLMEDHIAPDAVSDMVATAGTTNAITLTWTATGNNGATGRAWQYDIRISNDPITEENFEDAEILEKLPSPKDAGTVETFTIKGLEFSTRYYFAMKVSDRQLNISPMSNLAEATTPAVPVIVPVEDMVVQKIFPGSIGSRMFQIRNDGGSDIYYRIIKDTLSITPRQRNLGWYADTQRELGDILATYTGATPFISGVAWVDGLLYMCDMQSGTLSVYDTAQQVMISTVPVHDEAFGMVWDGEYLWIGDGLGNVYAYDTEGQPAGYSFSCPDAGNNALAWDGKYFLVNFILDANPNIYQIDETGTILKKFTTDTGGKSIRQSAWVRGHYPGNFLVNNPSGIISRLKLEEDHFVVMQQFSGPSGVSYALTHDRNDLWYGKGGGTIYRIDDGIDEVNWLTIDPDLATVPEASVKDISLTFDASKFDIGSYTANMVILSNDPNQAELRVPVDLQVTTIDIGPDTSFCGHLSITIDAGEGFAGYLWSDGGTEQVHLIDSIDYGLGTATFWVDVTDIGGTVHRDSMMVTFQDCTSIFEFDSGLKVTVYPNPSRGVFTVKAEGLKYKLAISLADISGKVIMNREMASHDGRYEEMIIDITDQPRGNYLLRISRGEGVRVERVVVY
jgi:hypothetical protein